MNHLFRWLFLHSKFENKVMLRLLAVFTFGVHKYGLEPEWQGDRTFTNRTGSGLNSIFNAGFGCNLLVVMI